MLRGSQARSSARCQRPIAHARATVARGRHSIDPRPGPARTRVPTIAAGPAGDPRPPSLPRAGPIGDRGDAADPRWDGPIANPLRPPGAPGGPRGRPPTSPGGRRVMTTSSVDLERALDGLLGPDPSDRLSDRVFAATFDRTTTTTQRRSVGVPMRSRPHMSLMLRLM